MPNKGAAFDAAALRARLAGKRGRHWWRALDEIADHPGLPAALAEDFPALAALGEMALDRRQFLKLAAATLVMGGLAGCGRAPVEDIVPYVYKQEGIIPGKPLFYASAMPRDGYGLGILAESNMGRPTKIEGNPKHPASLGGSDVFMQASVLQLWDPDRSQTVMHRGVLSTWSRFAADLHARREALSARQGEGLRVLTGTVTSPTLTHQLRMLQQRYPSASWHAYQPVNHDHVYAGSRFAFGRSLMPHYDLSRARTVVSLDADFLAMPPGHLRHAHDFADGRRMLIRERPPLRLYATASGPSLTAATADHRWPMPAGRVADFARQLAVALGLALPGEPPAVIPPHELAALVDDLRAQRGGALIIAGLRQPPEVHALAHWMNETLGSEVVGYHAPVESSPLGQGDSLRTLAEDMAAGKVDTLIILGGNPVYETPADVDFAGALAQVPYSVHLGLYDDETAARCTWHIPRTHYLEQWSDLRGHDGTVAIVQPLIAPLYNNKSEHALIAALAGDEQEDSDYQRVRAFWRSEFPGGGFDRRWKQWLHDGVIAGSAFPVRPAAVDADFVKRLPPGRPAGAQGLEVQFHPDPTVWDGQYGNLGWLQELPKPLTQLTWDNAALIAPATAQRLHLNDHDVVELSCEDRRVEAPVFILPGLPAGTVSVSLGYGRTRAGQAGTGGGFDAYRLRTLAAPWFQSGGRLRATGRRYPLATAQHHHTLAGRDIIRTIRYEELLKKPAEKHAVPPPSLYPGFVYDDYKWAMSVDLNTCIGCGACVAACQAENNIPVVGKGQVIAGREMQWLRIDRYFQGPPDNPDVHFQPVPCMQCEHAPCELVCPVEASIHDDQGINVQVYNRCIGTRFCSNNCPYKVRRFNFLAYARSSPGLNAQRNPEVTVRSKGVMEKCNYCLQRITRARIMAEERGERVRDGEVMTACQTACPTQAIVFGDLNDPIAAIHAHKSSPLDYTLLEEANTRPRTTYLSKVRHPNARLEGKAT
jgi:molybdopterin-containing oxidoreductase family iron-sulfur binding subunit